MDNKKLDCMEYDLSLRQVQLYNLLRQLWIEHSVWTRAFIISAAYDLGDLDVVTKRLLRNPTDFAYVLSQLYGKQSAIQFENLLTEHLLIAAQLLNAAKVGDTETVDEQRVKWYRNADDIANFLGEINPYWNKKTWQSMLYDHLRMVENEAIQILTGQYQAGVDEYDSIQNQSLTMADEMACGIIKQFNI